jgi:two-component system sensor histidine kinase UhpB
LARDLHDGVGQSINLLLVQIRLAVVRGEAGLDDLRVFERGAEHAIHCVRALAYGVRQKGASDPLEDARDYAEHLLAASGSSLSWIDERTSVRLGRNVSDQIAWCVRESITNAVHHANARLVEVRLVESGNRIRVTVRDDGVGFLPESLRLTSDGHGLGLLGNAERMAEIGGTFKLHSAPGQGTLVLLEAPRYLRRPAACQPLSTTELKVRLAEEKTGLVLAAP